MGQNSWTVATVGDLHLPFVCKSSGKKVIEMIREIKPTLVIQMGDLYDMYSFNRFGTKPIITVKEELEKGADIAQNFWRAVQTASPNSECVQLKGNHDIRALKKDEMSGGFYQPLLEKSLNDLFTFDGVTTIQDPRDTFEYKGVCYTHGHRKHGDHIKETGKNTVTGHLHRGIISYYRVNDTRQVWEMSCGYLADPFSPALIYRPMNKYFGWNKGLGIVDEQGPRFISF